MTAVQSGNLEAIKLLVTCNANINAQNSYHGKLLFNTYWQILENSSKYFFEISIFGVDFNKTDYPKLGLSAHFFECKKFKCHLATPLMLAIADGKLSIIQYLLKNGADTEIQDYRKQKAADWAEERGNHEALSYITKHDQEKRR